MRFDVISLFPEVIGSYCSVSIIGRALKENHASLHLHQLRDFGIGNRKNVDEKPFGGGHGLILRPEPIFAAHRSIPKLSKSKTVVLTPRGKTLTQPFLREKLSKEEQLIIICGRYEGIDERVMTLADYQISLGNYILTGGEIGAMILIDSLVRLLPGTFDKGEAVAEQDSFSDETGSYIEAPQYTQPRDFEGLCVPDVLLSGNHAEIANWKNLNRVCDAPE